MIELTAHRESSVRLMAVYVLGSFEHPQADALLAAALNERRAAINAKESLARQLSSRLAAEHSRWLEFDHRLSIYENRILPQTREQAQAALAAYQSDTGDFADVMRSYIDDLNTRLDHSRLQVERAKAYAVLANLGGLPR